MSTKVTTLLSFALLVGCQAADVPLAATAWPKFRNNAAQTGATSARPRAGGRFWSFPTGKGIFSSPIVAEDGTIYVGSADRTFYAIGRDGTLRWSELTGEIIDSAGLLDDQGRVYFGSGDGKLRARDAKTGAPVWEMQADDPSVNSAFINWFEGNVAIAADGTLYAPNDNFFIYAVDRATGAVKRRIRMPDQTWSLPAIDVAHQRIFAGNNNVVSFLGNNLFSFDNLGKSLWESLSAGTIAASPLLDGERMVVGSFDGYVRSYDANLGTVRWEAATRDHVYASAARLPDGTLVQPSCDGTLYGLDPDTGAVRWAYDTREPIRSSPAVAGDGTIYVGTGDGRLLVVNPDGHLRWSMQLISDARNDLNSSPALGVDAIYLGGESGELFSVPFDFCLGDGRADPRCRVGSDTEDLPDEGTYLLYTTPFGALLDNPPAEIDAAEPIVLTLVVRQNKDSVLAQLDSANLTVTVSPPVPFTTELGGDGKFLVLRPSGRWGGPTLGVNVQATVLGQFQRDGLRLSGGTSIGQATASWQIALRKPPTVPFVPTLPPADGQPGTNWELARLSLPLPTLLPSYNQIGFDSLHYAIGVVEDHVAWMVGAKLAADENRTIIDPSSRGIVPLALQVEGGTVVLENEDGLKVEVMNVTIPFRTFRFDAPVESDGAGIEPIRLVGSTICAQIPVYGTFLQKLGLCNPQTDVLTVYGGANLHAYVPAPIDPGGSAVWSKDPAGITATITGSSLRLDEHVFAILLVDAATGKPVTFDYGVVTRRSASSDGRIATVTLPIATGRTLPASMRAYLMVDTTPLYRTTL